MKCRVCGQADAKVGSSCFECLKRVETAADTIKRLGDELDDVRLDLKMTEEHRVEQVRQLRGKITRIRDLVRYVDHDSFCGGPGQIVECRKGCVRCALDIVLGEW